NALLRGEPGTAVRLLAAVTGVELPVSGDLPGEVPDPDEGQTPGPGDGQTPDPGAGDRPGGSLPVTGVQLGLLGLTAALLVAGLAAIALRRRRDGRSLG
ncbi:MAG: LPXTG cell wall anchor domain-containing protein, partial [Cellulomonadaceae bacterium]